MAIKTLVNFGTTANDHTGDTPRAGAIKLSAPFSKTYVATAQQFGGTTKEATITATIAAAVADGVPLVEIPQRYDLDGSAMLPYDDTLVTRNSAVQLYPEGGNPQVGVYDARAYGGLVNAWRAIAACAAALPASGGIIDCRSFTGAQTADVDVLGNVTAEKPIKFLFGPSTWTCTQGNSAFIMLLFGSGIEWNLNETTFKLNDGQNQSDLIGSDPGFNGNNPGNTTISVVNGTATATIATPISRFAVPTVNKSIAFLGHTPKGGQRDNTTLATALTDTVGTTVTLTSISGQVTSFLSTGYIKIDNEIIAYPVSGISGNTLTGVTRGALGSTAATHLISAAVDRVVFDNYMIRSVSGTGPWTVVLDRNVTLAPTMTAATALLGPCDISFTGTGTFDGNKPAADTPANGIAIQMWGGARLKVDRGIKFQNWDHGGVQIVQHQFASIDGSFVWIGTPSATLGFSIIFFEGCQSCVAYGDYENINSGPTSDDRTTLPQHYDNSGVGNVFLPRSIRNVNRGFQIEGTSQSQAYAPRIENWGTGASGFAFGLNTPQWVTAGLASGNIMDVGFVSPASGVVATLATGVQNNFVFVRTQGAQVVNNGDNTNTIITVEGASQLGLKIANPMGLGIVPPANVQFATQSPTTLTQTINQSKSPDGTVNAYMARVFNNGGDAVPVWMGSTTNHPIALITNATKQCIVPAAGGFVVGTATLVTSATVGFIYIPTMPATASGTPAAQAGTVPLAYETTGNHLMVFSGGAWKQVALA